MKGKMINIEVRKSAAPKHCRCECVVRAQKHEFLKKMAKFTRSFAGCRWPCWRTLFLVLTRGSTMALKSDRKPFFAQGGSTLMLQG